MWASWHLPSATYETSNWMHTKRIDCQLPMQVCCFGGSINTSTSPFFSFEKRSNESDSKKGEICFKSKCTPFWNPLVYTLDVTPFSQDAGSWQIKVWLELTWAIKWENHMKKWVVKTPSSLTINMLGFRGWRLNIKCNGICFSASKQKDMLFRALHLYLQ